MQDYICTYGGTHFFPMEPREEDFHIADVAHALSLICRGNGHVRVFFSVGQHCVNCAREAGARGLSPRLQLACLLHDASEAYMSDVPRPFKKYLKDYNEREDAMLSMIYKKYLGSDLTAQEMEEVKAIDNDELAYDLVYLLRTGNSEASLPALHSPVSYEVRPFEEVERDYLALFHALSAQL